MQEVRHPIMIHHWRFVTFLHWRYPVEVVQRHLPDGLEVQTFDGDAWVGLIPLLMDRVRPPGLPAVPWLSRFPETNVRTYVRAADGRTGIWFFSLDAARLPAVAAAHAGFGLPYRWSDMSVERNADVMTYRSRRRWPAPFGVTCTVRAELGGLLAEADLGPLDHFLTARHRLFSVWAGRLVEAEVEHGPWPLRRARPLELRQGLVPAAGLPTPGHEPVAHASTGVVVRVGRWHHVTPG